MRVSIAASRATFSASTSRLRLSGAPQRSCCVRTVRPLRGLKRLALQHHLVALVWRDATDSLNEVLELPALLLGLTLSLPGQRFTNYERAALDTADKHAGALSPVVGGARPVSLRKIQRGEIIEADANVRASGPSAFS
jgi:hypothetical protein